MGGDSSQEWVGQAALYEAETNRVELGRRFILRIIYLVGGLISIAMGFALVLLGYGGAIDFGVSQGSDFEARLTNASPGIVFLVVGLLLAYFAAAFFKVTTRIPVALSNTTGSSTS